MSEKKPVEEEMTFILEWVGPGRQPEDYLLYACRGEKKGCKKRRMKTHRHCADCVLPDMDDTLEELRKKMMRGNA